MALPPAAPGPDADTPAGPAIAVALGSAPPTYDPLARDMGGSISPWRSLDVPCASIARHGT